MPRKYKATRGKKKIPRRLYKRRYKNPSVGKIMDEKINTTIEKRMKAIAIQTHNSKIPKLIFRQYLLGTFSRVTNIFGWGSPITWDGQVMSLVQIQKVDNATAVTIPPVANVQQTPSTYKPPGGNVIGPVLASDGFRNAMHIRVHGVSLDINIEQPRLLDKHKTATDSTPDYIPTYAYSEVWMAVLTTYYENSDLIAVKPLAKEVLQVPIYGWNSKIDKQYKIDHLGGELKTRVLWKKKIRMPVKLGASTIKDRKYFLDFKKRPIKIQYHELDQNGQSVIGPKLFFAIRSTIPSAVAYDTYKPRVRLVAKTFYTNPD